MKRGDYAYIPGSGPADKRCKDCDAIHVVSKRNGKCHVAAKMRGRSVLTLETIPLDTAACKFYEPVTNG